MKRFLHNRVLVSLTAAALVVVLMAALSVAGQGEASPVANLAGVITSPFRSAASAVGGFFGNFYSYIYEVEDLKAEISFLRSRIAAMEEEVRAGEQVLEENERLHNLLGLAQKRRDFEYVMGDIVSRGTSNWESVFTINKGSGDGVKPRDCVVDETGALVGQVSEVGDNWAVVSTLIDTTTQLGAQIYRTGDTAVLEGDFALMGRGLLMLTYISDESRILNGDLVLTSGVGEIYPDGLVVGTVAEVRTSSGGTGSYAIIQPDVSLDALRQVFVVTAFDISG